MTTTASEKTTNGSTRNLSRRAAPVFTIALVLYACAPTTGPAVEQAVAAPAPVASTAPAATAATSPTRPAPDYLPPPAKVEGPRIGLIEVPSQPPFVGKAGVDAHGYPLRHPDKAALLNLLRLKRFDLLEQFFNYYQEQFEADFHNEEWPSEAASSFDSPDPEFGPLLDEWVAHSPDAFAAWLARGVHTYGLGWHMRGNKVIRYTSPAQITSFGEHVKRAIADVRHSLSLRPQLQVAAEYLLYMVSTVGANSPVKRKLLNDGLAQCPLCYDIRSAYQSGLTPRWGGSWSAMDRFADESDRLTPRNSKLVLLRGASAADRCSELRESRKTEDALVECAAALKHGDKASALVDAAYLFYDKKAYTEALAHAERALRVDPQNTYAIGLRLTLRIEARDYLGAARDLVQLRHLLPTNEWTANRVDWLVKKLTYEGHVRVKAGNNSDAAPYFQLGLELAPDNTDLMRRQGFAARGDVAALLAEAATRPDDFELRLRIDHALATKRQFAKWHLGKRDDAIADMNKACALGMQKACNDALRMQGLQ
jgi:tetratricopeptide (TPR) repeat protein